MGIKQYKNIFFLSLNNVFKAVPKEVQWEDMDSNI